MPSTHRSMQSRRPLPQTPLPSYGSEHEPHNPIGDLNRFSQSHQISPLNSILRIFNLLEILPSPLLPAPSPRSSLQSCAMMLDTRQPFRLLPLPLPPASGLPLEPSSWGHPDPDSFPTDFDSDRAGDPDASESDDTELLQDDDDHARAAPRARPAHAPRAPRSKAAAAAKQKKAAAGAAPRPSKAALSVAPAPARTKHVPEEGPRAVRTTGRRGGALSSLERERERLAPSPAPAPTVQVKRRESGRPVQVQLQQGMELVDPDTLRQCQYCGSVATPQWRSGTSLFLIKNKNSRNHFSYIIHKSKVFLLFDFGSHIFQIRVVSIHHRPLGEEEPLQPLRRALPGRPPPLRGALPGQDRHRRGAGLNGCMHGWIIDRPRLDR